MISALKYIQLIRTSICEGVKMSKYSIKRGPNASIDSMDDLNDLFQLAISDVMEIAAPAIGADSFDCEFSDRIRVTNNKQRLGSCRIRVVPDGEHIKNEFEISISRILFHSYDETESVMYHEVIHMLPGCFNHGPQFKKAAAAINRVLGINVETSYNATRHGNKNPDGTKIVTFDEEQLTLNDIVAAFGKTMTVGKKHYRIDGYDAKRPKYCIKVTDVSSNRTGYTTKNAFADAYANGRIE